MIKGLVMITFKSVIEYTKNLPITEKELKTGIKYLLEESNEGDLLCILKLQDKELIINVDHRDIACKIIVKLEDAESLFTNSLTFKNRDDIYCDGCLYLNPDEKSQTNKKEQHICLRDVNLILKHFGVHPHIPRPNNCPIKSIDIE